MSRFDRWIVALAVAVLLMAACAVAGGARANPAGAISTEWLLLTQCTPNGNPGTGPTCINWRVHGELSCPGNQWSVSADGAYTYGPVCNTSGATEQVFYHDLQYPTGSSDWCTLGGYYSCTPYPFTCPVGSGNVGGYCVQECGSTTVAVNGQCVDPCTALKGQPTEALTLDGNWVSWFSVAKAPSNPWTWPVSGDGSVTGNATVQCWVDVASINFDQAAAASSGVVAKGYTVVDFSFRGNQDTALVGIDVTTLYGTTTGAVAGSPTGVNPDGTQEVYCSNCDVGDVDTPGFGAVSTSGPLSPLFNPQYTSISDMLASIQLSASAGGLSWLNQMENWGLVADENYNGGDPIINFSLPTSTRLGMSGHSYAVHLGMPIWDAIRVFGAVLTVWGGMIIFLRRG